LRDDYSINPVGGLKCVYVSTTERYELNCFIGQYITTRNLRSNPNISGILRSTLEDYRGGHPIMVNELNAWIDKTLGYRAVHPDFEPMESV
jgi:hypothetical protein